SVSCVVTFIFSFVFGDHRDLHSFPTRRSSDLIVSLRGGQVSRDEPTLLGADLVGLNTSFAEGRKNIEAYYETLDARLQKAFNARSEEHTSELQSRENLVCRLLLEKKKQMKNKR